MTTLIDRAIEFQLGSDPASEIRLNVMEHLDDIRIGGSDVLVGVWMPGERLTKGGLLLPGNSQQEYQFQGVTGLVLKLGPHAYKTQKSERWFLDDDGNDDPPKVGEWVSFNFKQGESFLLGRQPCRLVSDQYILMRLPRPDLIA